MIISLLHPSRGRAHKAKETFDRWMQKSSGTTTIEHVISVDADDEPEKYYQLFKKTSLINVGRNRNLVDATNRGAVSTSGDIIVLLSDDFDCPRGWDLLIIAAFKQYKDYGIVLKTYDGTHGWIVTLPIMNRAYYQLQGYFYYPEYEHMFCDTDMTHKAELEGRLIVRNDLEFHHLHYSTGSAEKDKTNEKADATWAQGRKTYLKRVHNKFGLRDVEILNLSSDATPHINWIKDNIS
jgi:glycosyltransferase involved in cell wall biosynthesis